jgi:hypothetical protein
MKKFLLFVLLAVGVWAAPANAQQPSQALVVSSCGSASYVAATYGILTMDTTGKLCDSGSGGGGSVTQGTTPWVDNITQWASVTLGAATAWGTAPTGNVPGVNANILGPLGQQLAAASVPVVLTAAQISTLTPPAAITGFATQATLASVLTNLPNVAVNVAPVTTVNPAVVVDLRPDSPGIIALGQATKANSVPVAIASDQLGSATPANSLPTVSAGFTYTHITTATTTAAIKTGAGVLHTLCVNSLGTVASAITVDDALTATTPTIAVINSLALLGCVTYDVAFNTGLTIVTTGTVAPDVTVSWR